MKQQIEITSNADILAEKEKQEEKISLIFKCSIKEFGSAEEALKKKIKLKLFLLNIDLNKKELFFLFNRSILYFGNAENALIWFIKQQLNSKN